MIACLPLKCCRSLISRKARLARIFLLKTLVTFLIATPSLVWLLTAALCTRLISFGEVDLELMLGESETRGKRRGVHARSAVDVNGASVLHRPRIADDGWSGSIPNDTVRALSEFLVDAVSVIYDELLVEDLEDLAIFERHGSGGVGRDVFDPGMAVAQIRRAGMYAARLGRASN